MLSRLFRLFALKRPPDFPERTQFTYRCMGCEYSSHSIYETLAHGRETGHGFKGIK